MSFYFARCSSSETTFNASHERYDENVFAFTIEHREGECATLSLTLRNPRVGPLSQPLWAWLSYTDGTSVTPLFFGRLIGIPDMQGSASGFAETLTLTYVAKPIDFAAQRRALAEALAVLPEYDPIFIDENLRIDAATGTGDVNTALEARSARWQCSRGEDGLPLVVSYSDICIGEDGTEVFESTTGDPARIDPASINLSISGTPLDSVTVKASVPWKQDMTDAPAINLGTWSILTYTGEALLSSWPKPGAGISGGWAAAQSSAIDVYNAANAATSNFNFTWHNTAKSHTTGDSMSLSVNRTDVTVEGPNINEILTSNSQPGVVWAPASWGGPVGDNTLPTVSTTDWGPETSTTDTEEADTINIPLHYDSTWAVVPQSLVNLSLSITFDAGADRTETCNFTMISDVQPVLTDPADFDTSSQATPPDEVILEINGADPTTCLADGAPIDAKMSSYFNTLRGQQSVEYLLLRARALLMAGARIVMVRFGIPFDRAILLTCRKNVTLLWEKLPGGYVSGKVVDYSISTGEGKLQGSVTIAATVGRNDVVGTSGQIYNAVAGTGELVVPGPDALEPGIQQMIGQVIPVGGGSVAFSPALMGLDTAGNPMPLSKADVVISEQIVGSASAQEAAIRTALQDASMPTDPELKKNASTLASQLVTQAIKDNQIYLQIELRGTDELKFADFNLPTLEPLLIPKTIDLENPVTT